MPSSALRLRTPRSARAEQQHNRVVAQAADRIRTDVRRSHTARKSVGSLHDDLSLIANRVCIATRYSLVTVWVNDEADVYAERKEAAEGIAAHCLIGIYSMGMTSNDIVDDLLEARRERLRMGILD